MSEAQYRSFRIRTLVLAMIWLASFLAACLYWSALPLAAKALLVILMCLNFVDVGSVEQLFVPYEKYKKGREW